MSALHATKPATVAPSAVRGPVRLLQLGVAYGILPAIVVIVATEVVARYALHSPLRWSEEVVSLLLLIAFVGAIPVCVARDAHVRVESFYEHFGARSRRLADALGSFCGAVFLGMLALGAGGESLGMLRRGDGTEHLGMPHWPWAAAVAFVAGVTALWLVVRALWWRGDDVS